MNIKIRETTAEDLSLVQKLWVCGDVMRFVGFPKGLIMTDDKMNARFNTISDSRPMTNHYCIFFNDEYCGETYFSIDLKQGFSASLDIKLFKEFRGKEIAFYSLDYAIKEAFKNGAKKLWVAPVRDNIKALALYKRLGFTEKEFPDYLKDEKMNSGYVYMEYTLV